MLMQQALNFFVEMPWLLSAWHIVFRAEKLTTNMSVFQDNEQLLA
jgi:hypothetical protein